jgi:hypothetical protein
MVKLYEYVGSEHDTFVEGKKYTSMDVAVITGLNLATIRTRMAKIEGDVINDEVIAPKRKAFTNPDGTPFSQGMRSVFPDRCETTSEKLMNKYLRRAI